MPQQPKNRYPEASNDLMMNVGSVSDSVRTSQSSTSLGKSPRGKKPFIVNASVERGFIRLIDSTTVPFQQLANAVKAARGPGEQWWRRRLRDITGTSNFNELRFPQNSDSAKRRQQKQMAALNAAKIRDETKDEPDVRCDPISDAVTGAPSCSSSNIARYSSNATSGRVQSANEGTSALEMITQTDDPGSHRLAPDAITNIERSQTTSGDEPVSAVSQSSPPETGLNTQTLRSDNHQFSLLPEMIRAENVDPQRDTHLLQRKTVARASTFGHSSRISASSTKRSLTDDSNDKADEEDSNYAKRTRYVKNFSMSSIMRHLEGLVGDSELSALHTYIGKRCSITAPTLDSGFSSSNPSTKTSRASTWETPTSSNAPGEQAVLRSGKDQHACPTHESEYYLHYHNLNDTQYSQQPETVEVRRPDGAAAAVQALIYAKAHANSDEAATALLQSLMPQDKAGAKSWVDIADENGITALHLAVAYGFVRVCTVLVEANANLNALTNLNTTVSRFAKPAQHLAGDDIALYHRILICRQWIKDGRSPPLPADPDIIDKGAIYPRRLQRAGTTSTLETVKEDSVDDTSVYASAGFPESGDGNRADTQSLPLVHGADERVNTRTRADQRFFNSNITESPDPFPSLENGYSQTLAIDFGAAPVTYVDSRVSNPPNSAEVRYTGANAERSREMLPQQRSVNQDTTASSSMSSLNLPAAVNANAHQSMLREFSDVQHPAIGYSDMNNAEGEPFSGAVTVHYDGSQQRSGFSDDSYRYQQEPYEMHPSQLPSSTYTTEPYRAHPIPTSFVGSSLDPTRNELLSILDQGPLDAFWVSCPHGRPWNRWSSYCDACPPLNTT